MLNGSSAEMQWVYSSTRPTVFSLEESYAEMKSMYSTVPAK